jgi:hypothetical protein
MAGNNIYVKGSYVDIHDNQNVYLSVDKAQVRVGDNGAEVTEEVSKVESPDTGRTSSPAAPAPLTANQKVTACFEHGLLTAGKPYNQLFCLMAAMMARRILTDTSVPAFVRMVAASCPALLQNGATEENYIGAINDLTQKSRYSFANYIADQKTMTDFIKSCYPLTSTGKERKDSLLMVAKTNDIFLFLKED